MDKSKRYVELTFWWTGDWSVSICSAPLFESGASIPKVVGVGAGSAEDVIRTHSDISVSSRRRIGKWLENNGRLVGGMGSGLMNYLVWEIV